MRFKYGRGGAAHQGKVDPYITKLEKEVQLEMEDKMVEKRGKVEQLQLAA